jgi:hypothetical protein
MVYAPRQWDTILGIFLLILAVSGNYVSETLNCQTQKLLSTNIYAKNIIILMITYFSLGFASFSENDMQHPFELAGKSLAIWISFLIFNKMDIQYTIISIIGLFIILVLKNFIDYYVSSNENTDRIPVLLQGMNLIFAGVCLTIIIGFLFYFKRQYNEYTKSFSYLTFIFGKTTCKSITE